MLAEDLGSMESKFPRLMSYIFSLSIAAYGMTVRQISEIKYNYLNKSNHQHD